jgi:hypothetical protein
MTFPSLRLDLGDSAELAELLLFIRDWLGHDPTLAESLTRFVGSDHYPPPTSVRTSPSSCSCSTPTSMKSPSTPTSRHDDRGALA